LSLIFSEVEFSLVFSGTCFVLSSVTPNAAVRNSL